VEFETVRVLSVGGCGGGVGVDVGGGAGRISSPVDEALIPLYQPAHGRARVLAGRIVRLSMKR
jgi:hypothetical protein